MTSIKVSVVGRRGLATVFVCVAFVGTVAATNHSPVSSALAATESVMVATALADKVVVIAGGGLLIGLGISIVASSMITYKYKNNQIRSRLK